MSQTTPSRETLEIGGTTIPRIGLGTWELEGPDAEEAVRDALEIGYRHIDTARAYGNEREVGTAIGGSGIDRDEIWLTTKLWFDRLSAAEVREQCESSLKSLGVDHIDLLLVHWPNPEAPIAETLGAMAELADEGKTRRIGVSNFPTRELSEAIEASPVPLFANQIEFHPFLDQSPLLELAAEHGIVIEAYSPLAHGEIPGDDTLAEIGEAHGKSAAQVALRWLIEHDNVIALPRSSSHDNRAANLDVFDFELSADERERIAGLARPDGREIDPPFAPDWD
jgi:2,5-diketo-D-gluconate reductase B